MGRLVVALMVAVLALAGCAAANTPAGVAASGPPPNVIGQQLNQARSALAAAGWARIRTVDSVADRAILMESNWIVTGQRLDDQTVVLEAKKSTDREPGQPDPRGVLARKVEKAWLANLGVKKFSKFLFVDGKPSESLLGWISGFESPVSGVVVVTVQTTADMVDKAELQRIALGCFNFVGEQIPELDRVEVSTADGKLRGVMNRNDVPILN